MTSSSNAITLPPETILNVIDSLVFVPEGQPVPIALPASDTITKTLLALTRTSKLTYASAVKYLYSRCLYIDSFERLGGLTKRLELSVQLDSERQVPEEYDQNRQNRPGLRRGNAVPKYPLHVSLLNHTTSLYLSPFPGTKVYDVAELDHLVKVLDLLSPVLKRLVLSVPQKRPGDELFEDVKFEILTPTLLKLTSLEVFCSVKDSLWIVNTSSRDNPKELVAWAHWPKLKILALYSPFPSNIHWQWWVEMESLERLIFTELADLYDEQLIRQDLACWQPQQLGRKVRKLELLLVDTTENRSIRMNKDKYKEEDSTHVRQVLVPGNLQCSPDRDAASKWVSRRLLEGNETIQDHMVEETWADEYVLNKAPEDEDEDEDDPRVTRRQYSL